MFHRIWNCTILPQFFCTTKRIKRLLFFTKYFKKKSMQKKVSFCVCFNPIFLLPFVSSRQIFVLCLRNLLSFVPKSHSKRSQFNNNLKSDSLTKNWVDLFSFKKRCSKHLPKKVSKNNHYEKNASLFLLIKEKSYKKIQPKKSWKNDKELKFF